MRVLLLATTALLVVGSAAAQAANAEPLALDLAKQLRRRMLAALAAG